MASQSGTVGFIGGMDIPLIRKFACGYAQGVKAVNPDATIIANMTGTTPAAWNDPVKGGELTKAQISQGADVVYAAAGGTGVGVLQAAADDGIMSIGVDSNQNYLHPGSVLTSMLKRVDNAVYRGLQDRPRRHLRDRRRGPRPSPRTVWATRWTRTTTRSSPPRCRPPWKTPRPRSSRARSPCTTTCRTTAARRSRSEWRVMRNHNPGRADTAAPAIELKGISKAFGPVQANKDISIRVMPGTIHGIIGENGAGKSTLMSILYGFYKADAGEIFINGQKTEIPDSQAAIAAGIGMVFQHFKLVENFTVLENVILGAEDGRAPAPLARQGARQLCRSCPRNTSLPSIPTR